MNQAGNVNYAAAHPVTETVNARRRVGHHGHNTGATECGLRQSFTVAATGGGSATVTISGRWPSLGLHGSRDNTMMSKSEPAM